MLLHFAVQFVLTNPLTNVLTMRVVVKWYTIISVNHCLGGLFLFLALLGGLLWLVCFLLHWWLLFLVVGVGVVGVVGGGTFVIIMLLLFIFF